MLLVLPAPSTRIGPISVQQAHELSWYKIFLEADKFVHILVQFVNISQLSESLWSIFPIQQKLAVA